MPNLWPARIVCLSAEAVDILYRLGCQSRIVGVTGFAPAPAAARKPRVSGFSSFDFDKIAALKPDLVITFSDVQAAAASELVRRGHTVLATNQRSLAQTYQAILLLGRAVGCDRKARRLIEQMTKAIRDCRRATRDLRQPRVYFEEWDRPLISGIGWVGELVEIAGGCDIFPELRGRARAPDRVVSVEEVVRREPDVIVASWCGKKVDIQAIRQRPGFSTLPAVQRNHIYELKSQDILQPGPGLLKGLRQLRRILDSWRREL